MRLNVGLIITARTVWDKRKSEFNSCWFSTFAIACKFLNLVSGHIAFYYASFCIALLSHPIVGRSWGTIFCAVFYLFYRFSDEKEAEEKEGRQRQRVRVKVTTCGLEFSRALDVKTGTFGTAAKMKRGRCGKTLVQQHICRRRGETCRWKPLIIIIIIIINWFLQRHKVVTSEAPKRVLKRVLVIQVYHSRRDQQGDNYNLK